MLNRHRTDLIEMARIGFTKDLEIYVNTNDAGTIPHFHVRDAVDWDRFHTCIQIEKPEYFLHGNKQDVLNSRQKKLLNDFMNAPVAISRYSGNFANNWELTCFLWDLNNSKVQVSDETVQPDYTLL